MLREGTDLCTVQSGLWSCPPERCEGTEVAPHLLCCTNNVLWRSAGRESGPGTEQSSVLSQTHFRVNTQAKYYQWAKFRLLRKQIYPLKISRKYQGLEQTKSQEIYIKDQRRPNLKKIISGSRPNIKNYVITPPCLIMLADYHVWLVVIMLYLSQKGS